MMIDKAYLGFGLGAAMLYALGAASLKAAGDRGVGVLRITVIANLVTAAAFSLFLPWREGQLFPTPWWPSLALGGLFFAGQVLTILAFAQGCVSVATPVMGVKVVIVAFILAIGLGHPLGAKVWIAAFLTTAGIGLLAFSIEELKSKRAALTVGCSLLVAIAFALFDVITQVWSPTVTFGRLMPWSMIFGASLSLALLPAIGQPLWQFTPGTLRYLAPGILLLTAQSVLLVWSIGHFQDAAGLNVVYGSRGIWSILVVWLLGAYFWPHQPLKASGTLAKRLLGAALIASAVILVFWR